MDDNTLIYRLFNNAATDIAIIKQCFDNNSLYKDEEKLKWLYLNGPHGFMEAYLAIDEQNEQSTLAAMYALFPVKFRRDNEEVVSLQSLDTITDINYRGKGLFKKLSSLSYDECTTKGYKFIYGFPNKNSAPGFFNKLGWEELGEVPFLILPINLKYFIRKIPAIGKYLSYIPNIKLLRKKRVSNDNIRTIDRFDKSINDLWIRFSKGIKVAIERDADYLNWRFLKKPNENYEIKGYFQNGKIDAFIIYTAKEKHDGKIGYIMEFIYNPDNILAANTLMTFAKNRLIELNADACLTWVFSHSISYRIFRKNKFLNLPKYLRPIELHFGIKKLSTKGNESISILKNWYLSYSDSDTV